MRERCRGKRNEAGKKQEMKGGERVVRGGEERRKG